MDRQIKDAESIIQGHERRPALNIKYIIDVCALGVAKEAAKEAKLKAKLQEDVAASACKSEIEDGEPFEDEQEWDEGSEW